MAGRQCVENGWWLCGDHQPFRNVHRHRHRQQQQLSVEFIGAASRLLAVAQ